MGCLRLLTIIKSNVSVSISNIPTNSYAKVHWPWTFLPYSNMKIFASQSIHPFPLNGIITGFPWSYWLIMTIYLKFTDPWYWFSTFLAWWKYVAINLYPSHQITLMTLFNIVVDRYNFFLNFDVCVVWCSEGSRNSQECKSFEIDTVTIKKSMTEYHHWINGLADHLF